MAEVLGRPSARLLRGELEALVVGVVGVRPVGPEACGLRLGEVGRVAPCRPAGRPELLDAPSVDERGDTSGRLPWESAEGRWALPGPAADEGVVGRWAPCDGASLWGGDPEDRELLRLDEDELLRFDEDELFRLDEEPFFELLELLLWELDCPFLPSLFFFLLLLLWAVAVSGGSAAPGPGSGDAAAGPARSRARASRAGEPRVVDPGKTARDMEASGETTP